MNKVVVLMKEEVGSIHPLDSLHLAVSSAVYVQLVDILLLSLFIPKLYYERCLTTIHYLDSPPSCVECCAYSAY